MTPSATSERPGALGKNSCSLRRPPVVSDTWSAYYQSNSAAGAETWMRIAATSPSRAHGQLTSPTSSPTISNLTVNGTNVGNVTLDIGTNGLTQYARADGTVQVTDIGQNGYAVGELMNVAITDAGRVRGNYSNGQSVDLFSIPLASFNGDDMLKRLDGAAFTETAGSGPPILGRGGASCRRASRARMSTSRRSSRSSSSRSRPMPRTPAS